MKNAIKNMKPVEIRVMMLRAGITLAGIARALDVDPVTVYQVVNGISVSHRVRTKIAELLGIDIKRIWPETYLFGGPRKPGRPLNKPHSKAA
jgi:lambda repressor-like predicted transcriptional regulator